MRFGDQLTRSINRIHQDINAHGSFLGILRFVHSIANANFVATIFDVFIKVVIDNTLG